MAAITRIAAPRLMEANRAATELLLKGLTVDGLPDWNGGRGQTMITSTLRRALPVEPAQVIEVTPGRACTVSRACTV